MTGERGRIWHGSQRGRGLCTRRSKRGNRVRAATHRSGSAVNLWGARPERPSRFVPRDLRPDRPETGSLPYLIIYKTESPNAERPCVALGRELLAPCL